MRIDLPLFFLLWIAVSLATGRAEEVGKYRGPCAVVASGDGKTLYVANADGREVAWVELPGGTVTRRIAVPAEPTAYVCHGSACLAPARTAEELAARIEVLKGRP